MSVSLSDDKNIREAYEADASGLHLLPELVARPESMDEVVEVMRRAASDRLPVTSAGAQTSTTGASITDSGILLSLRSLAGIWIDAGRKDEWFLDNGAVAVKKELDAIGVECAFEMFDAGHGAIEYRYPKSLAFLCERLSS